MTQAAGAEQASMGGSLKAFLNRIASHNLMSPKLSGTIIFKSSKA
jgi:hypothetical protein